jgi:acetyl esterase
MRADHLAGTPEKAGVPRPVAGIADEVIGGVPCRVYEPFGTPVGTLVNLHGGGWVLGTLDTYAHVARALCAESGARVVNVDYRVAPEDSFPAAVEDAWAVVAALDAPVALCGESAGGNLAAVCARGRATPAAIALQVLVFPVCDVGMDNETWRAFAEGFNLDARDMRWFWETYLAAPTGRTRTRRPSARRTCGASLPRS